MALWLRRQVERAHDPKVAGSIQLVLLGAPSGDPSWEAGCSTPSSSLPTTRVLLLVNYRPEYRHGWGGKSFYTQLRIDPWAPTSAAELLDGLLGTSRSLEPLERMFLDRTGGNPFFLEESVPALIESGVLVGERGASVSPGRSTRHTFRRPSRRCSPRASIGSRRPSSTCFSPRPSSVRQSH